MDVLAPIPPILDPSGSTEPPVQLVAVEGQTPAVPDEPKEPEITSETLYIQNLNERIKVDGLCSWSSMAAD